MKFRHLKDELLDKVNQHRDKLEINENVNLIDYVQSDLLFDDLDYSFEDIDRSIVYILLLGQESGQVYHLSLKYFFYDLPI